MAIGSILAAILVLAVVIFVHELGHFLVGKWCDVEVRKFSIGFGPTLLSRTVGETEYRLAAIPLGGYVQMAGFEEDGTDPDSMPGDSSRGFIAKPLWQRAAIVAAGPFVNLLFAFLLVFGCALFYGAAKPAPHATIDGVLPGRPAAAAGMQHGDTVVSVDGKAVATWEEMVAAISASEGRLLRFEVQDEAGTRRNVDVTPAKAAQRSPSGEQLPESWQIGVSRAMEIVPVGPLSAVQIAAARTWGDSVMIVRTFVGLVTGHVSARDLGGPVMVVAEASRQAQTGLANLLLFMAIISINLGIVNLLPIPVLDGGHLVFMAAEMLRGKPLPLRVREFALGVGMAVIGALMIFVVLHDLVRVVAG